jgi:hypothetical protein
LTRLFLASLAFGLLLTFLAATFFPLPEPAKIYSQATVLANGGREEVYFIRLPDDRLGSPRAAATASFPQQAFSTTGQERVLAELFRVRNAEGEIVGLATRMNGNVASLANTPEAITDWMLLLPGRGALLMTQGKATVRSETDFPVDRMGFSPANSGVVVSGTGDFADLVGFYQEKTAIERVDADGQAYGLVTLSARLLAGGA